MFPCCHHFQVFVAFELWEPEMQHESAPRAEPTHLPSHLLTLLSPQFHSILYPSTQQTFVDLIVLLL